MSDLLVEEIESTEVDGWSMSGEEFFYTTYQDIQSWKEDRDLPDIIRIEGEEYQPYKSEKAFVCSGGGQMYRLFFRKKQKKIIDKYGILAKAWAFSQTK